MKKVIIGASILLTGAIIFLSVFCATGSIGLPDGYGWDQYGRFWNAMAYAKLIPIFVISIIIMLAGIAIMVWGNIKEK